MTSYHGGKQKMGKDIAEVIVNNIKNMCIEGYCEPFCGMLGVYNNVHNLLNNKLDCYIDYQAGDINESLILMWKRCQKGWIPPKSCTEEYYNKLKKTKRPSAVKGFIGHQYSFGGQYFKGYRALYKNKENYEKASIQVSNIAKQLKDVKFKSGKYNIFSNLKNYVIYCDPPYSRGNYYFDESHNRRIFNHIDFWNWCLKMSEKNIVFVSEYSCPIKDKRIKLIYNKKVKLTGSTPSERKRFEKLYMIG